MQKRKEIHVNFAQIDEVNIPAMLQAISGEFGRCNFNVKVNLPKTDIEANLVTNQGGQSNVYVYIGALNAGLDPVRSILIIKCCRTS